MPWQPSYFKIKSSLMALKMVNLGKGFIGQGITLAK